MKNKENCPYCKREMEKMYGSPSRFICDNCGMISLWEVLIKTEQNKEVNIDEIRKREI